MSTLLSMTACSGLPDIEPLKDRFIYLIEGSRELNVIFFGRGLPVYDREGILSDRKGVYSSDLLPAYDTLTEKSPYFTVDSIKERAEQIFSESYLDLIYESAFDGVVASGGTYLRFYDYSTMKIVTPSNSEYINVTVMTYTSDNKKPKEITLSFAFERGDWYLDCPTY